MAIEIITKDDLEAFRQTLLNDIRALLANNKTETKEWLRCADVRKILKVSTGTVQNLRITGKLKSQKVGGIHFYKLTDIENMVSGKGKWTMAPDISTLLLLYSKIADDPRVNVWQISLYTFILTL
jgi:hypothetical protein